jgi:integrase
MYPVMDSLVHDEFTSSRVWPVATVRTKGMLMTRGEGRKTQKRGAFGTAHKLPSGRYRAMYHGPDGRRHSAPQTFVTERDARGWLSLRQSEIIRKAWLPPDGELLGADNSPKAKLTLADYAEQWLSQRDLKPRTRGHYRKLLDQHILPPLGNIALASITVDDVRGWHTATLTGAPTLRAHAYGLLRAILATAVGDQKIPYSPCTIRGAGSARRAITIRPASIDELTKLVDAMPPRYQCMVLLAAWCAMRYGEITELRRKDIDLDEAVIRIRRGVVNVRDGGGYQVGTPKSLAGVRDVAIPPHLLPAIRNHLVYHTAPGAGSLLFPADHGGHLHPATLERPFFKARDAAGRPDLRFHDLRHTGAVLAAQTGATLAELMARLGHSSVGAALRYQHVGRGRDQAIAEALSKMAGDTP